MRDEHAIERIAMITREPAGALRVEDRNIEALEALARQTPWNVSRHVGRAWQFPDADFRGDFPRGRGAHQDRGLVFLHTL